MSTSLFIGIDAGGSKTALVAGSTSEVYADPLLGPGANPNRVGFEAAAETLAALIENARARFAPEARVSICAGVAGVGRPDERTHLQEALRTAWAEQHGAPLPGTCTIVTDADIALAGALGDASGVLLIAGTGSILLGQTPDGRRVRAGGWGYLLGDEGSGYAIGMAGLQAVADAFDGGPATVLTDLVAEAHGLASAEALIHKVYHADWSPADVAPLVLAAARRDDMTARRIVHEEIDQLLHRLSWLYAREPSLNPILSYVGGVVETSFYQGVLANRLAARLAGWRLQAPNASPVQGALQQARAQTAA